MPRQCGILGIIRYRPLQHSSDRRMKFLAVLTFLGLLLSCEGGALLTQGVKAAKKGLQALGKTESQADDIATAIFNGKLASMFGIRADGTFFGDYVIVNSQLYKMSNIAGGAAVFGGGKYIAHWAVDRGLTLTQREQLLVVLLVRS